MVLMVDETEQEVVLPLRRTQEPMAEGQGVLVLLRGNAPLSQIESARVAVGKIVTAETVAHDECIEIARPGLKPRKDAGVIVARGHVCDHRTRQRRGIHDPAFVVDVALTGEEKRRLLPRERTAEGRLHEATLQILGRRGKRIPRGEESTAVGHLENAVVPASPAAL